MRYNKKTINEYAVGNYVDVIVSDGDADTMNLRGWLMKNDPDYHYGRSPYLLLQDGGKVWLLTARCIERITFVSNGYTIKRNESHRKG